MVKKEGAGMKVMYFLHEGGEYFNGASRSALAVIRANAAAGNENVVVIPKTGGRLQQALEQIPNTQFMVVPSYRWKVYPRSTPLKRLLFWLHYLTVQNAANHQTARRLSKEAKRLGVDLLHSNSSVIPIGGLVSRYSGLPHIWHFREFGEEDFHLQAMVSKRQFYRFVERYSDMVVCISRAIAQKNEVYLPQKQICVIYNGVNVPEKLPEHTPQPECWKLLISGTISRQKGQWIAVEALEELRKKGVNAELYIAGKGNLSELGQRYEAVKEHIHLLGFVDDMKSLRAKMDVELMCSVSEGFGRTTVEAMGSGLLVVGADGGATPELIAHGKDGFLFPVNDFAGLAQMLERVMALSPEERKIMRKCAYQKICSSFTEEKYTNQVLALYRRVMQSRS